jgi:hypothetical protein
VVVNAWQRDWLSDGFVARHQASDTAIGLLANVQLIRLGQRLGTRGLIISLRIVPQLCIRAHVHIQNEFLVAAS